MNAHALLTSQGWLGTGHALDSRLEPYYGPTYNQKGKRGLAYDPSAQNPKATTGNGLVKPLLVSQRHGSRYGLGKKAHEPQSGNEWWLKGFQSALDNIGKSGSERTSGTSTPDTGSVYIREQAGLYGYFVKGQFMSGTIAEDGGTSDEAVAKVKSQSKKRKSDALEEDNETSQLEMDPLAVSPVKRPQAAQELEVSIPYLEERDKSRRVAHRRAQSTDEQQFAVMSEFFGAAEGATKKEKQKKKKALEGIKVVDVNGEDSPSGRIEERTSKEHRTHRKRQKEEKEGFKLLLAQMVQEEMAKLSSMEDTDDQDHEEEGIEKPQKSKTKRKPQKIT